MSVMCYSCGEYDAAWLRVKPIASLRCSKCGIVIYSKSKALLTYHCLAVGCDEFYRICYNDLMVWTKAASAPEDWFLL